MDFCGTCSTLCASRCCQRGMSRSLSMNESEETQLFCARIMMEMTCTGTATSMHDLVLALWTCQIRQGMALCRTLGREESECHTVREHTTALTLASDHDALERTVVDFETRLERTSGQWRRLAPTMLIFPASMRVASNNRR